MRKLAFVLIMLFGTVGIAYADCLYNGAPYPTETRIGPYVCQPDGTWK